MSIKNVVLVGASGNLGPSILNALLNQSSFNVTVLSREGSTSTFPDKVKVVHADYESQESLKAAFQGQDAIVSNIPGHALQTQTKLIDAAIAAGVKRFIPSEFGSNTVDPKVAEAVPILKDKIDVQKYLHSKEKEISWTVVIPGPFFDWGLKFGLFGLNSQAKTVTLIDGGEHSFSATNLRTIGLAVVKILEKTDETKNQNVYISSFETSQKQLLDLAEKTTGETFKTETVSSKDLRADGLKKLQAGDYSGIFALIQAAVAGEAGLSDHRPVGLWNDKLGLEKEDFEESFKTGFSGKLVGE